MRILIATIKSWNINNAMCFKEQNPGIETLVVTEKEMLSKEMVDDFCPEYIFFPHWSWIIPSCIYENYNCVVFHMTDLPFGRGGSPLQNLLVRGIYDTKVSAIRVTKGMDTGDVYLKCPLDISFGSAEEIFRVISDMVFKKMIPYIIKMRPEPKEQKGEVVLFERRTPEQSKIPSGLSQRQLYDYIRMLDGEGYPTAYVDSDIGRIYFRNAQFDDGKVTSEVLFKEE